MQHLPGQALAGGTLSAGEKVEIAIQVTTGLGIAATYELERRGINPFDFGHDLELVTAPFRHLVELVRSHGYEKSQPDWDGVEADLDEIMRHSTS